MLRGVQGVALLMMLACTGCSNNPYVPVSGRVTMDGQPLAKVQVIFQPNASTNGGDTGGVGSFAMTDEDGRFTLEAMTPKPQSGAIVGKHTVRIAVPPPSGGGGGDSDSDAGTVGGKSKWKQTVPDRYNEKSELKFDVPAGGTDQANFELKSKP